jgi:hypothetical protein
MTLQEKIVDFFLHYGQVTTWLLVMAWVLIVAAAFSDLAMALLTLGVLCVAIPLGAIAAWKQFRKIWDSDA